MFSFLHLATSRLFQHQQALAQFAPPGVQTGEGGAEIVPNAPKVLGNMVGTDVQGGFFHVLGQAVAMMTGYFLGFIGFIAVLALVYAGFLWVTSAANPDNIKKAKEVIKYVVIGLVLAGFAYAIVRTITYISTMSM